MGGAGEFLWSHEKQILGSSLKWHSLSIWTDYFRYLHEKLIRAAIYDYFDNLLTFLKLIDESDYKKTKKLD